MIVRFPAVSLVAVDYTLKQVTGQGRPGIVRDLSDFPADHDHDVDCRQAGPVQSKRLAENPPEAVAAHRGTQVLPRCGHAESGVLQAVGRPDRDKCPHAYRTRACRENAIEVLLFGDPIPAGIIAIGQAGEIQTLRRLRPF